MIGLVTDEIASSPFAGRLLRGAMDTAWDSEHLVLTVDSGGDPAKEDAAVAELLDRRVDGIIYAAMSLRRVRVPEGLHRTHSVLANCLPEDDSLPAVIPAERAGGRTRRPRCCSTRGTAGSPWSAVWTTSPRWSGCAASGTRCAPRASPSPKEWIVRTGGEISAGYEGALRLLDGVPADRRPTGIFCYNDRVAAGVLHAATRLGHRRARRSVRGRLRRPGAHGRVPHPPLTTVALPHRAMGEAAARLLLDAIEAGPTPPATVRRLACPVVSRALGGTSAQPGDPGARPRHGQLRRCRRRVGRPAR